MRDGERLARFARRPGEGVARFADRLAGGVAGDSDGDGAPDDAATAGLQLLVRGDLPAPAGAEVFALHPAALDAADVRLLSAADLAARLDPAASFAPAG